MDIFLSFIGHLSFFLTAISFMMRNLVWLRVFALASGSLGIFYNSALALGWLGPANPELWNVVAWISLFFAINVYQSFMLVRENMEIVLPEHERELMSLSFPAMRSGDFAKLLGAASREKVDKGEKLVSVGDKMSSVMLVLSGSIVEKDVAGNIRVLKKGHLAGEISFSLNEQYGGSPSSLVVGEDCELAKWDYEALSVLSVSPVMKSALLDGFLRGMTKKREFLLPLSGVSESEREVPLSSRDRMLHASVFPSMTTLQFSRLMKIGVERHFASGETIDMSDAVGVVVSEIVRVAREDGQSIYLGSGNLLGEVAFMSSRTFKVPAKLLVHESAEILFFDSPSLLALKDADPPLFIVLMEEMARDMANKLTQPLLSDKAGEIVYDFGCKFCPADKKCSQVCSPPST